MFGATAIESWWNRGGVVAPTDMRSMRPAMRAGQFRGRVGMAHHTGGAMTGRAVRGMHASGVVGRAFHAAGLGSAGTDALCTGTDVLAGGYVAGGGYGGWAKTFTGENVSSGEAAIADVLISAGVSLAQGACAASATESAGSTSSGMIDSSYQQQYEQALAQQRQLLAQQQQLMLQQQQQRQQRSDSFDWKPLAIGGGIVVGGLVVLKVLGVL